MFLKIRRGRNLDVTIRGLLSDLIQRAAWVLAGGRSSRMGTDKALLEIEGQPLVLRVADRLAEVCGSVAIIGEGTLSNPGQYANLGLRVVPDSFPGLGPLAGIEAALAATSAEANLIAACDMPSLDASALEALFAAGGDCAVPRHADGRIEPLCAVYHRRIHARVRELLESGIRGVTEALRLLETGGFALRYVQVTARDTFANLNTPEDLARYRAEYSWEQKRG